MACSSSQPTDINGRWVLSSLTSDGEPIDVAKAPSIDEVWVEYLTDGTFHGQLTCNEVQGDYIYTESVLANDGRQDSAGCGEPEVHTVEDMIAPFFWSEFPIELDTGRMTWEHGTVAVSWTRD